MTMQNAECRIIAPAGAGDLSDDSLDAVEDVTEGTAILSHQVFRFS